MADKEVVVEVRTEVEDDEVESLEEKLDKLESKQPNIDVDVDDEEVDETESKIDNIDGTEIAVSVNNTAAMAGVEQIGQGFDRLKAGASELGAAFSDILSSAGKQEMNKTFLEMNLGAEKTKSAMQDINNIIQDMPGDDTALQGLLSQAMVKNAQLTTTELRSMATAATDYFSAMSFYGKSATEAQQDMTNYILSGNTAELERSPILQSHIDKLKEADTIQERSVALQEALNEEGWGNISQQDTYNNKLETFLGMIDRGKYTLGGMFQEGAKGGMDFLLKLDEATNGMVGMSIAAASFATPLFDSVYGLGQMALGMKALKDVGIISWFKELETVQKLHKAITSALIPVEYAEGTAGWFSIGWMLVAVAIGIALGLAFLYLYENCDWFREGVNNLAATLMELVNIIESTVMSIIDSLIQQFNDFTNQLGLDTNNWIEAVMAFILFIPTLPARLALELANALAKALGFKTNFVQSIGDAASQAVASFKKGIAGLSDALQAELNAMLESSAAFRIALPGVLGPVGSLMLKNWKNSTGENSPGYMYYAFKGELDAMEDAAISTRLPGLMSTIGTDVTNSFSTPSLLNNEVHNSPVYGGNGITINLEIGSVDNEDRVNEIVEAVRKALNWDNRTAGRTV